MSKFYKSFVSSLIIGFALTGLSLFVSPKVTITKGPSCSVCMDIDGGTYRDKEQGWPLRFLQQDEGFFHETKVEAETRTSFKPLEFIGNWALWSVVSGVSIAIVQKTRRTK